MSVYESLTYIKTLNGILHKIEILIVSFMYKHRRYQTAKHS